MVENSANLQQSIDACLTSGKRLLEANEGAGGQARIQPRGFRRSLRPAPNSGQFDRAGQKSAIPHDTGDH